MKIKLLATDKLRNTVVLMPGGNAAGYKVFNNKPLVYLGALVPWWLYCRRHKQSPKGTAIFIFIILHSAFH
jgi:hypothetical protein